VVDVLLKKSVYADRIDCAVDASAGVPLPAVAGEVAPAEDETAEGTTTGEDDPLPVGAGPVELAPGPAVSGPPELVHAAARPVTSTIARHPAVRRTGIVMKAPSSSPLVVLRKPPRSVHITA
jgi:hypothetical protein